MVAPKFVQRKGTPIKLIGDILESTDGSVVATKIRRGDVLKVMSHSELLFWKVPFHYLTKKGKVRSAIAHEISDGEFVILIGDEATDYDQNVYWSIQYRDKIGYVRRENLCPT